jgi:hypothetical protein
MKQDVFSISSNADWEPWELLIAFQLVKIFHVFVESEGSLPCSQECAISSYPEPDANTEHPYTRLEDPI